MVQDPLFGNAGTPGADGVRRVSLVRLSGEIARCLAACGRIAVEGEVVAPRQHPGGTYFTLRDRAAQLAVRCPPAALRRCRAVSGERVLVTGTLAWLPERGAAQLVADEVVPVGAGAIAAELAERRRRLAADGLLERPRRRLPRLPATIAVVCGSEAAVRADIESVVVARFPGYPVDYVTTNVSGPGAAQAIVEALRALDGRPDVEVVVLARGGGDAAQLLAFSDEELCRAIAAARTPVVSAVGHERDRPLCDEVADARFATPSLAAAAVVPSRAELDAELRELAARAFAGIERRRAGAASHLAGIDRAGALRAGVALAGERLANATARFCLLHPARRAAAAAVALERVDWRSPARRHLGARAAHLAACRRQLEALSPAQVLARGYAVVRTEDGTVVRRAGSLAAGQALEVHLARGVVRAVVEQVQDAP